MYIFTSYKNKKEMQAFLDVLIAPYRIRWIRECVNFVVIVGGIFLVGIIVLYHQAFYLEINHYWNERTQAPSSVTYEFPASFSSLQTSPQYEDIAGLEDISLAALSQTTQTMYDYDLESYLSSKLSTYTLAFNRTVPWKRIIIPSLWVDVNIVDVNYASDEKLIDADFDAELMSGVVRYPFTALPGEKWNSLVFGHSSVDAWEQKDNDYGFVFYKLHKMLPGEEIHVIWEGKRHTYVVEEKVIKRPDEVGDEIKKYTDGIFLTLMACFPVFTDTSRTLITARYKEETPHLAKNTIGEVIN